MLHMKISVVVTLAAKTEPLLMHVDPQLLGRPEKK
jgi:hypothetical protein